MGKFDGPNVKPHWLWTNHQFIQPLIQDGGRMSKEERLQCSGPSLVRRYIDRNGKKRVVGTKFLKGSQFLGLARSFRQYHWSVYNERYFNSPADRINYKTDGIVLNMVQQYQRTTRQSNVVVELFCQTSQSMSDSFSPFIDFSVS